MQCVTILEELETVLCGQCRPKPTAVFSSCLHGAQLLTPQPRGPNRAIISKSLQHSSQRAFVVALLLSSADELTGILEDAVGADACDGNNLVIFPVVLCTSSSRARYYTDRLTSGIPIYISSSSFQVRPITSNYGNGILSAAFSSCSVLSLRVRVLSFLFITVLDETIPMPTVHLLSNIYLDCLKYSKL